MSRWAEEETAAGCRGGLYMGVGPGTAAPPRSVLVPVPLTGSVGRGERRCSSFIHLISYHSKTTTQVD